MLQPRESRLFWRSRRRRCVTSFCCTKSYLTLLLIACITLLPQVLTQHNDDVYIVKPTPALPMGKEELTTVLLVNNESLGRYINVRPDIGLLTSTARTFIQEGVTTEFATQVLGTTLDNGRVYAQYLKKSSRVLYDSGNAVPSVVTSWVGETLRSETTFLPQSHNDLFDADITDWQAIDDRLLGDHQHKIDFIGNTDYVGLRLKPSLSTSSNGDKNIKISMNDGYTSSSKQTYNFVTQLGALEDNARKVAANKVFPIENLPTYTIKHNYEPNIALYDKQAEHSPYNNSAEAFDRNPKLIYKKKLKQNLKDVFSTLPSSSPIIPVNRHFATVTYYGFADFTTLVGDSVIVFSPSSSTNKLNFGHVTSIKGEATLGVGLPQGPSVSKVSITIAQDIIEPTITLHPLLKPSLSTALKGTSALEEHSSNFINHEVNESKVEENQQIFKMLETSKDILNPITSKMEISKTLTTTPTVMLSRPSDEEILLIFNSLANANANIVQTNIQSTPAEKFTHTTTMDEPSQDTSNLNIFGGATTIFLEEDHFANFLVPSKTSMHSTMTADTKYNSFSDGELSSSKSFTLAENSNEISTTTTTTTTITKSIEEATEKPIVEYTSDELKTIAENDFDTTTMENILQPYSADANNVTDTVLIEEFDFNNYEEVPGDCISTSQVFLTQIPKTVTLMETVVITDDAYTEDLKTEIRQKIEPTFEIREATKYYCIKASTIEKVHVKSSLVNLTTLNKVDQETYKTDGNESDIEENITETTTYTAEDIISEVPTERNELNKNIENTTEYSGIGSTDDIDEEDQEQNEDEEVSAQTEEYDEGDEEIELIYKTLYTTYTYLTTFFHDASTSISSHTEVVTNIMTSTFGIDSNRETITTNLNAYIDDNEINPTHTFGSQRIKSTKRFMVPSEVETFIRSNEDSMKEIEADASLSVNSNLATKNSETMATFYTTYTYYTTIFADGETELMSHTEVITNIKKSAASSTTDLEKITSTNTLPLPTNNKSSSATLISQNENDIGLISSSETEINPTSIAVTKTATNHGTNLPSIPELGDLSAITLVTDVRSSSSSGNTKILNNVAAKNATNKVLLHETLFEDQISSESNTDTDEIMPSATLLLQTSFTTFTYYTTMYSGDKRNVVSRLETMTNTVTETLQLSKSIDLEAASVPVTYFTTFTYWTKLAREGEITTLSREETISNIVTPTMVQQQIQTRIGNPSHELEITVKNSTTIEAPLASNSTLQFPMEEDDILFDNPTSKEILPSTTQYNYSTHVLEPTTYYTTYTYYTTSYETDKTVTDSRFETVTNVVTPTITITDKYNENGVLSKSSTIPSSSVPTQKVQQEASHLILYDFKKIIDADGISTIFLRTEIKPTVNLDGISTEVISSSSSLFINENNRRIQATAVPESTTHSLEQDVPVQKQYKTGLVRLIEGTRIANRTTTLYQSKVIGTVIDQRYAQIIESTSSFIFEKTKAPPDGSTFHSIISPASSSYIANNRATEEASIPINSLPRIESSIIESSSEQEANIYTNLDEEVDRANSSKAHEKLRFPFQTKKLQFLSPLKPFSNRSRPHFAPKKNSSATIITRSDFTPTITATPALKTTGRFSSIRKGSASANIFSNSVLAATSSRRFGRPSKSSSISGATFQTFSFPGTAGFSGTSRNRFASSTLTRNSFISSSRRLGGSVASIRPSLSRSSSFSSSFTGISKVRLRLSTTINLETSTSVSSQEEENLQVQDEVEEVEEENTTETNRRQNNPLLRLRRPLNKPQAFTPARAQANSPNNAASLRRNPLTGRSRNINAVTSTTTTSTIKPKSRTFQPPFIAQNRIRPVNSLFPPRNIFGVQKPAVTTEETRDLSEEDTNENNDDSEYEDEDDEETDGDETEENRRRRRSNNRKQLKEELKARSKREADSSTQIRSNFRSRFRRPKLAMPVQSESRTYEDEGTENRETTTPTPKTRSRFAGRYSGHISTSATTTAASPAAISYDLKAIRPTRPSNSNGGRAQFTLHEKDSSTMGSSQKGVTSAKRPAFRKPLRSGSVTTSRRMPSATAPSSTSGKRRLKNYTNNDVTTTSRNSVTSRSRPSSSTSARVRTSGASRDSNIGGRNRARINHSYNNNENPTIDNSGTIIVTHVTAAETTIPIVNGKLTEYKQVVTAKTSTEVLGPQQYTSAVAANGLTKLALTRQDTLVNYNGATEVTKYILHETPTTIIAFTPTTIRGRKTSFSHVIPSTVYSVEQVVSTVQPQISANAPLANILLSQLLLGNVGLPAANPLLGALGGALMQPGIELGTAVITAQPPTPLTEYKTHASTYITTVYQGQSTVLPVTFHGKKILTTVFDTTAQTITATEFITDTIVTTPTLLAQSQPVVNSLLLQQLLLQQHLQQQQQLQQPTRDANQALSAILNSVPPQFLLSGDNLQELESSNKIRGYGHNHALNEDDDFGGGSSVDFDDIMLQAQAQTHKNRRKKTRKNGKNHKRKNSNNADVHHSVESSVITLYLSGRRPGEFSTVLSTVQFQPESTQYKRHVHTMNSLIDYFNDGSDIVDEYLALPPGIILLDGKDKLEIDVAYANIPEAAATQPLESIVGDISLWCATQSTAKNTNSIKISDSSTKFKNQISINVAKSPTDLHVDSTQQLFFA